MYRSLRSRLTYANVVASIALFLALGGGLAWALERNSVKSKHIVNGQVKGVDVNEGSLDDVVRGESKSGFIADGDEQVLHSVRDGDILLECDSTPVFKYEDNPGDDFPTDLWTLGPGTPTHQNVPDGTGPVSLPDDGGDAGSNSMILQIGGELSTTAIAATEYEGPEEGCWANETLLYEPAPLGLNKASSEPGH